MIASPPPFPPPTHRHPLMTVNFFQFGDTVQTYNVIISYHRLYSQLTAMYESGGTRWFVRGRTDTIRSCTNAAHTFVIKMADPMATVNEIVIILF